MTNPLQADLDHILAQTEGLWEELRGSRLFITGGTGFFGCWLLESFAWANDKLGLNASALVLTRDPEAFRKKAPHLFANPGIRFLAGDVSTFDFPTGEFACVIHAATEANVQRCAEQPLLVFNTIVEGTRRTLDFAVQAGVKKLLLTSSGAVYGPQPPGMTHIPETYTGGPDPLNPQWAYGEGKRAAEMLCALYARQHGLEPKIARCFAFVGPYLPRDAHFAIGNFIRDALRGGLIQVKGDGTPWRSYLYAADLAIWLWTILFRGTSGLPYNVGSEEAWPIAQWAELVAQGFTPCPAISIAKKAIAGSPSERYVPSIARAGVDLGLRPTVDLKTAIEKTIMFEQKRRV
ncbi:MAG: NAD(P)-dependent oxidoreductase [Kiritimatiellaeota bacterium]|nr:NAD(P)-dependent oxidoreductase [Kiritimatiellota bacterium]